jgi:hypothetical protein
LAAAASSALKMSALALGKRRKLLSPLNSGNAGGDVSVSIANAASKTQALRMPARLWGSALCGDGAVELKTAEGVLLLWNMGIPLLLLTAVDCDLSFLLNLGA